MQYILLKIFFLTFLQHFKTDILSKLKKAKTQSDVKKFNVLSFYS
jgi:hypothetical protein